MIKILIADDHPVVRNGIKNILEKSADLTVAGEAENARQVYKLLAAESWDVVILDLKMPDVGGIDILKVIREQYPGLPVIILSSFSEHLYGVPSIRAGASAFLNKASAPSELANAVQRVVDGKRYISESLAERLADNIDHTAAALPHLQLSPREFEVMRMIGSGLRVSEIAKRLSVSVSSVNSYRTRVFEKMDFSANEDLVKYMVQFQLFE